MNGYWPPGHPYHYDLVWNTGFHQLESVVEEEHHEEQ